MGRASRSKTRTHARARKPRRFTAAQKVFHLISGDDFVDGVVETPGEEATKTRTLRPGALTSCCRRPVAEVYGVAQSKEFVTGVKWCKGAV